MNADSIPSQCIFCTLPYFRQGETQQYVMSYFCLHCRTKLTPEQWKMVSRFFNLFSDIESNPTYWDKIYELSIPHEELILTRTNVTRKVFEFTTRKAPRVEIFNYLQGTRFMDIAFDRTLDIIELLEEYDRVTKENEHGS